MLNTKLFPDFRRKPMGLTKSALPVRHENSCAAVPREHAKITDQPKLLQEEAALTFLHNYGSRGESTPTNTLSFADLTDDFDSSALGDHLLVQFIQ